jgi:hypothetical protein
MPQTRPTVANALPLRDLYLEIEDELYARIVKALEFGNWNEDFLSRTFCEILQEHSPFSFIAFDDNVVETTMTFRKQSGPIETKFGDIGVTVRFTTKAGQAVVGCAFLEAKRRYPESRTYQELRWEQLEEIEENAPHAMLLLYDFEDVRFNEDVSGSRLEDDTAPSRAIVLPISLARAIESNTIDLYQSCTPLAHQVCYRYLQGLDLEIVEDPVKFFAERGLKPKYVLQIMVNHHGADATPTNTASSVPVGPSGGGDLVEALDAYDDEAIYVGNDEEDVVDERPVQAPVATDDASRRLSFSAGAQRR